MKKLFILLTCALVTACGGNSDSHNLATSSPFQGYWLQKDEAEELRATGRMDSLCPELHRDPAVIINTRLIDAGGSVYAYNPAFGRVAEMLMGSVTNDGAFTPPPSRADKHGITKGRASIQDGTLTFTFELKNDLVPRASMSYLRSDEQEIRRYFAAQEACIH
jgi:hypothetical protein